MAKKLSKNMIKKLRPDGIRAGMLLVASYGVLADSDSNDINNCQCIDAIVCIYI